MKVKLTGLTKFYEAELDNGKKVTVIEKCEAKKENCEYDFFGDDYKNVTEDERVAILTTIGEN